MAGMANHRRRQTGSAKDRPRQGRPKRQMRERTVPWLGWQYGTRPSPALSLPGNGSIVSILDCRDHSQSSVICHRYSQQTTQKTSSTDCLAQKGTCAVGPTTSTDVKVLLRSAAAMSISHLRYENRTCEIQAADAFSKRSCDFKTHRSAISKRSCDLHFAGAIFISQVRFQNADAAKLVRLENDRL